METLQTIRDRFLARSGHLVSDENEEILNLFEKWSNGQLTVEGSNHLRKFTIERPKQLSCTALNGGYWLNWGSHH